MSGPPDAVVYLHGFASGPGSKKARFFGDRFAARGVPFLVPDLAAGNFSRLTLSGQLAVVGEAVGRRRVTLMGSSMGGYLAALFASANPQQVGRAVLMAPAFDFAARWRARLGEPGFSEWERSGTLPVFHYGEGRQMDVGFELYSDATSYAAFPRLTQPVLVFHGVRDDVVPASLSESFSDLNPGARLRRLDSNHELLDVTETIWKETWDFLQG